VSRRGREEKESSSAAEPKGKCMETRQGLDEKDGIDVWEWKNMKCLKVELETNGGREDFKGYVGGYQTGNKSPAKVQNGIGQNDVGDTLRYYKGRGCTSYVWVNRGV